MTFESDNKIWKLRSGKPALRAEFALKAELKAGGIDEIGAYKKMRAIWAAQIEKAMEGNTESAKLIIERLDGKPKQQIDTNVNVNVQFEQILSAGRARALSNTDQPLTIDHEPLDTIERTIEHDVIAKE